MDKNYEMVTVKDYVESLDNVKYTSISQYKVEKDIERYLLNKKRYETNAKIVEALLA